MSYYIILRKFSQAHVLCKITNNNKIVFHLGGFRFFSLSTYTIYNRIFLFRLNFDVAQKYP